MTYRIGPKGQVVIPKTLRDRLGTAIGDEVEFSLEQDTLRLAPIRGRANLRGSMAGLGLVGTIAADRAVEQEQ
jgi:AbrB family looped-hinge helix DNA binding protein